jgi:phosphoesterase RecJ-like protein
MQRAKGATTLSDRTDANRRAAEVLSGAGPFVLTSHRRPDGDALGSMLALRDWLRSRGSEAEAVSADAVPDQFAFIPGADTVVSDVPASWNDYVAIALDTPDASRTSVGPEVLEKARLVINIDHHPDNPLYGDINIVDTTASSAALLVYELLGPAGEISSAVATALFAGVMTDTGGFRFGNTDSRTLSVAASLVSLGAVPSSVSNAVYGEQPLGRLRLLGLVLASTVTELDGKAAVSLLTEDMKRESGSNGEDLEGLASYGRLVAGVEVALLLREEDGRIRASLRSKGAIDVNAIAVRLGGGGHRAAAGVVLEGTLDSARRELLGAVEAELSAGDAA